MGLWVRASEWDIVREAMRHSPSEADGEMIHQDAIYREFLSRAYKQDWAVEFIEAAKRRSATNSE